MIQNYKISIVVPVYNTEEYLEHCLDTLLNQTYRNLEIILVDDGSTDSSSTICDEYEAGDERVKVIHKENGGLISAWKRGVDECTGEYISFVDSDDWISLDMMETMSRQLTGSTKEIVASDYVIEYENGKKRYVWQSLAPGTYTGDIFKRDVVPQLLGNESRKIHFSRCMKLISCKLILDNAHYSDSRIRMGEDITVMLPALMDCERLVMMNRRAWYHYFYWNASMVHKYDATMFKNMQLLRGIIYQVIKDKMVGLERQDMNRQADKEYIFLLLLVLKNEARGNPRGYRQNILDIARSKEVSELVNKTPVAIADQSNKLTYYVLKHPNVVTVSILRLAMQLYYAGRIS